MQCSPVRGFKKPQKKRYRQFLIDSELPNLMCEWPLQLCHCTASQKTFKRFTSALHQTEIPHKVAVMGVDE